MNAAYVIMASTIMALVILMGLFLLYVIWAYNMREALEKKDVDDVLVCIVVSIVVIAFFSLVTFLLYLLFTVQ